MIMDILLGILAGSFLIASAIGALVLHEQKKLDAPYAGVLVVEVNRGEPASVYFRALEDPKTFTDGMELKLKVRVLEDSQQ